MPPTTVPDWAEAAREKSGAGGAGGAAEKALVPFGVPSACRSVEARARGAEVARAAAAVAPARDVVQAGGAARASRGSIRR